MTRIQHYAAGGRGDFMNSTLMQDAVLWNLQLLSSAALRVSAACKSERRELNWGHVCGLFREVAQDPWHLEPEAIWQCVERELPAIRRNLAAIMRPTTGQY